MTGRSAAELERYKRSHATAALQALNCDRGSYARVRASAATPQHAQIFLRCVGAQRGGDHALSFAHAAAEFLDCSAAFNSDRDRLGTRAQTVGQLADRAALGLIERHCVTFVEAACVGTRCPHQSRRRGH
jgi:hypothetical protein